MIISFVVGKNCSSGTSTIEEIWILIEEIWVLLNVCHTVANEEYHRKLRGVKSGDVQYFSTKSMLDDNNLQKMHNDNLSVNWYPEAVLEAVTYSVQHKLVVVLYSVLGITFTQRIETKRLLQLYCSCLALHGEKKKDEFRAPTDLWILSMRRRTKKVLPGGDNAKCEIHLSLGWRVRRSAGLYLWLNRMRTIWCDRACARLSRTVGVAQWGRRSRWMA